MASFATEEKERLELYKLIIGCVVPRPIAWVATRGHNGVDNLAPFSFFNAVGSNPPTLAFSCGDRGEEMKDTSRNLTEQPDFVVHIVSETMAEKMNETCADFGAHVSEFTESGLTPVPGTVVRAARIKEALVAMECRVSHHLRLGEKPPRSSHILGEVLYWHIDDSLLMERGRINADVLQAIGRMGGVDYVGTANRFGIDRPVIAPEDPRSIPSYQKRGRVAPKPLPST